MTTATAATDLPAGRFFQHAPRGFASQAVPPSEHGDQSAPRHGGRVPALFDKLHGRSHWRVGPDLRGDAGVLGPVGRRSLYPVRRAGRLAGDGIDRRPAPQALRPHDGHCSPGHQPAHRGPSLGDAGLPRIAQRVSGAIPCVSHETVQMKEV